jgi:hypothetical protein
MKERPILMSGPMIRSLLKGAKRETRRIVKPQPTHRANVERDGSYCLGEHEKSAPCEWRQLPCHYAVGMGLWVRETWSPDHRYTYPCPDVVYRADGYVREPIECRCSREDVEKGRHHFECLAGAGFKWRPSIFMPRRFSRINLSVTSLAVERVQSITDEGAMREGMIGWTKDGALYKYAPPDGEGDGPMWPWVDCPRTPRDAFERLWGEINGRESWEANVWVRVIGFDVVKGDRA